MRARLSYDAARQVVLDEGEYRGRLSVHAATVLKRDGWTCTGFRPDPRPNHAGEILGCSITGSEISVLDDRALCPRCAGSHPAMNLAS